MTDRSDDDERNLRLATLIADMEDATPLHCLHKPAPPEERWREDEDEE